MVVERKTCAFSNLNEDFVVKERNYSTQFAGIYFTRLNMLRRSVVDNCMRKWVDSVASASPPYVNRILDVPRGTKCFFVGTVYKDMPLKPSILDELSHDTMGSLPPPPRQTYWGDGDEILMEDESGRIKLTGELLKSHLFVTGAVLGVLGFESNDGCFEVKDICFPTPQQQTKLTIPPTESDAFIVLASGLNISSRKSSLEAQLAFDYLSGDLADMNDEVANIVRVVFAGNTLDCATMDGIQPTSPLFGVLEDTDLCLHSLAASVPISVMPGERDPGTAALPQQPLHTSLFPKSSSLDSFDLTTNPTQFEIDGTRVLGCSGQNVEDIMKYQNGLTRMSAAEHLLLWNHLAPSAPDTLWCYPFQDRDPFVLTVWPHLFFIGNQPSFETKLVHGPEKEKVRVVLVPNFSTTRQIVLVNLRTLDTKLITF
ncbi:DNA directed, delta 2, regulatory subunit [Chytridium lagenaria]|nr:DNA directed, delta 2, regulatory subunit [Chytridium lagenaria]